MNTPRIFPQGVDGLLVRFGDVLDDETNARALQFADVAAGLDGVLEAAGGLISVYVRFDPMVGRASVERAISAALANEGQAEAQPSRLWTVPCCFAEDHAPQLAEAAELAGVTPDVAVTELCAEPVRVMAIGFAPGQPYLGLLPDHWNIPRQTNLTAEVPQGALTVAVRQLVLFANPSPTGWRQVGRTGFRCFDMDRREAFALKPGDLMQFEAVSAVEFESLINAPMGGAVLS